MSEKKLTMVVPAYNEEEALPIFYAEALRVEKKLPGVEIEYLFIDDGSSDGTLEVLRDLHKKDARVRYVSFSRNFGKEAAIYAGLQNAAGDYVAILDADLQDPPALLPEMLQAIEEEGYDCVGSKGRAADPVLFCQNVLPYYEEDFKCRYCGWSQRLSVDEPQGREGDLKHGGVQSLFQGYLWLGRFPEEVAGI